MTARSAIAREACPSLAQATRVLITGKKKATDPRFKGPHHTSVTVE